MNQLKKIYKDWIEPIFTSISGIVAIIDFIKYIRIPLKRLYDMFIQIDLNFIFSIVLIFAFCITTVAFIIWQINVKRPQKSLSHLLIPYLLPKDKWIDTENEFNKRLKSYNVLKISQLILIIGLALTIGIRFLK